MPIQINGTLNTITGITAPIGYGAATGSNNITLTAASGSNQYVTPTGNGFSVTLPDATTMALGADMFTIYNNSEFFYGIKNNAGTLLGFVPPRKSASCSLAVNTTAAGTWNLTGAVEFGITASSTAPLNLPATSASYFIDGFRAIRLTSSISVLLFGNSAGFWGVAYNETTGSFGSVVLVRSGNIQNAFYAIKNSDTSLLVFSNTFGGNAQQAVLLSLSGTTITVNTAATATLATNISSIFEMLYISPGTFLALYSRTTAGFCARIVSVSGTTVTIGTEVNPSSGSVYRPAFVLSSSVVVLCYTTGGGATFNVHPYSVSGTTLSAGTNASVGSITNAVTSLYLNPNGRIMFIYATSTNWAGGVASISGTTASISTANLAPNGTTTTSYNTTVNAGYTGNQLIVAFAQGTTVSGSGYAIGANILTDNAGTAVAGTLLRVMDNINSSSWPYSLGLAAVFSDSAGFAFAQIGNQTYFDTGYFVVGVNGNNPSLIYITSFITPIDTPYMSTGGASNFNLPNINYPQSRVSKPSFGSSFSNSNQTAYYYLLPSPTSQYTSGRKAFVYGKQSLNIVDVDVPSLTAYGGTFFSQYSLQAQFFNLDALTTDLNQLGTCWFITPNGFTQTAGTINSVLISNVVCV